VRATIRSNRTWKRWQAAGIKITDVDELIALKIQGVTPEYIKGMHDLD